MRGKGYKGGYNCVHGRITPAYAGKRYLVFWISSCFQDHPRVCGEKSQISTFMILAMGSPPRMRGKGYKGGYNCVHGRITPAYAGKRRQAGNQNHDAEDHPRVCGEKFLYWLFAQICEGSPPRMRGKVLCRKAPFYSRRITPAYAGKRLKRSRSTVSPVAIVPLFPSVCNKPVVSDGSPAVRDVPLFLPAENAVPASPACNLRSL